MHKKDNTESKRLALQDMVAGGIGEAPDTIIELPEPDEHGNKYRIVAHCKGMPDILVDTLEHAQMIVNIKDLDV